MGGMLLTPRRRLRSTTHSPQHELQLVAAFTDYRTDRTSRPGYRHDPPKRVHNTRRGVTLPHSSANRRHAVVAAVSPPVAVPPPTPPPTRYRENILVDFRCCDLILTDCVCYSRNPALRLTAQWSASEMRTASTCTCSGGKADSASPSHGSPPAWQLLLVLPLACPHQRRPHVPHRLSLARISGKSVTLLVLSPVVPAVSCRTLLPFSPPPPPSPRGPSHTFHTPPVMVTPRRPCRLTLLLHSSSSTVPNPALQGQSLVARAHLVLVRHFPSPRCSHVIEGHLDRHRSCLRSRVPCAC